MKFKTFFQPNQFKSRKSYFINRAFDLFVVCLILTVLMAFANEDSDTSEAVNTTVSTQPYIGEIAIYPYNFAPAGWAKCDGQLMSIAQNSALFSLLGTQYGGDGETTFGLPDLRGRVPIGSGTGPGLPTYQVGQKSGSTNTVLSVGNLPAHNHTAAGTIQASSAIGDESDPTGNLPGLHAGAFNEDSNVLMKTDGVNVTVDNTGSGQQYTNMQPYLTMGYYIALQGVFPSPN